MRCLYPMRIKVDHKDAFGRIRKALYTVPCGKCLPCLRRYANEWAFRAMCEAETSVSTHFFTLTYDEDRLPLIRGEPSLHFEHWDKFFHNVRHYLPPLRMFGCGEYGDRFGRPHYHFIGYFSEAIQPEEANEIIQNKWQHGHTHADPYVGAPQCKYVAKYLLKKKLLDYGDCESAQARMSRRPGLAYDWCLQNQKTLLRIRDSKQLVIHDHQGTPYPIPRFIKKFCYSEEDKFRLRDYWNSIYDSADRARINSRGDVDGVDNVYKCDFVVNTSVASQYIKKIKQDPNNRFKLKEYHAKERYDHKAGFMECDYDDLQREFENDLTDCNSEWKYDRERKLYVRC